jgi:threonine dehydratase
VSKLAIDESSIVEARARIGQYVVKTPVLANAALDSLVGGRVFVKAENLQRTGSFKFRGAINRLLALSETERTRGIIAFSSGNHALAVAEAAQFLGCEAVLLMPSDAPEIKIAGTRARGADVVLYDRTRDDRGAIAADLVVQRGLVLIPPYDDPFVMAGQGTSAAEAAEQLVADFGVTRVDQAIICCSGGGLAAGWSTALRTVYSEIRIIIVEPVGFDDTARSLASGRWETNARVAGTICDALQVATPGKLTLPILLDSKASGVTVADSEVMHAMKFAAQELKVLLEPGGAAPLAALLAHKVEGENQSTLIIASGGNVDPQLFSDSLIQVA